MTDTMTGRRRSRETIRELTSPLPFCGKHGCMRELDHQGPCEYPVRVTTIEDQEKPMTTVHAEVKKAESASTNGSTATWVPARVSSDIVEGYTVSRDGEVKAPTGKILTPQLLGNQLWVALRRSDKENWMTRTCRVDRLVLEAFGKSPPGTRTSRCTSTATRSTVPCPTWRGVCRVTRVVSTRRWLPPHPNPRPRPSRPSPRPGRLPSRRSLRWTGPSRIWTCRCAPQRAAAENIDTCGRSSCAVPRTCGRCRASASTPSPRSRRSWPSSSALPEAEPGRSLTPGRAGSLGGAGGRARSRRPLGLRGRHRRAAAVGQPRLRCPRRG